MTKENREIRDTVEGVELRAAPEGSKSPGTMVGYAALFNKSSADLGMFREQIAPGAFKKALTKSDVRALVNHDPNQLLGRTSAGTLRLLEDEIGLRVEIDLPDTTAGRDTAESIRRRDFQGQSFSFTTAADRWDYSASPTLRTLDEVDELFDVGPVTFPAYEDTSVALRAYRALGLDAKAKAPASKPDSESDASASTPAHIVESEHDQARLRLLEVS